MNKKYETLVLASEEFGEDINCYLAKSLELLMKAGYECQVYDEGNDVAGHIYVINYGYDEYNGFGNATIHWMDPEDEEIYNVGLEVLEEMLEED